MYFDKPVSAYCKTTMETSSATVIVVKGFIGMNEVLFDEATDEYMAVNCACLMGYESVLQVQRGLRRGKRSLLKRIMRKLRPPPPPLPLKAGTMLRRVATVFRNTKGAV